MTAPTIDAPTAAAGVRRARRALQAAEVAHRATEDRIRGGDDTVTAADLAGAANEVRFAQLKLESAERVATEAEAAERAPRIARAEAQARRDHAKQRQQELTHQLASIRDGSAARSAEAFRFTGSRPTFPLTEAEFMAEHPTFVEGATHHFPPATGAST